MSAGPLPDHVAMVIHQDEPVVITKSSCRDAAEFVDV